MAVGKKDTDIEWPTFDNGDIQVSYSPGENEKIFTDFKPATEFHNIRNKKRKPKKKPRELRLISESEINRKKQSCIQDRKRCVVISVLIACIIVIVAICVFLGVYFGVIVKGSASSDQPHGESSVDVVTLSSVRTPSPTTVKHTTTRQITTPTSTKKPTTPTSTTTTTTTTTTSTMTSTTTTTTTTTTTPAPTEPPVKHFSGSTEDTDAVLLKAKLCREEIIITTDRVSQNQKCSLYFEMLRCVYILSLRDQLHVPVDTLGKVVEDNKGQVFPIWIEIDPASCRDNGTLDIGNITTLPHTPAELCSSPDAVMYYGARACQMVQHPDVWAQESDTNKCRIRWGVTGCVSRAMSCQYEEVESVVNLFESDLSATLFTANQSLCNDLYTSILQSSPCSMTLYKYMEIIFSTCSKVIQKGSELNLSDMACTLFEVFFECSFTQIPSLMRYETCQRERDNLRSVTFDIAQTAEKVNPRRYGFINVSACIDKPMASTYICESPDKLVTVVDTECYKKFSFVTENTICKYLSEYIYECGSNYTKDLGVTCTDRQIKDAMITESEQILKSYGFDMTALAAKKGCIVDEESNKEE